MTRAGKRSLVLIVGLALGACGDGGLQVKGAVDRVVGETVTFALNGDPPFNGDLSVRTPDGASLSGSALQVAKKDDRILTFVIPSGIAQGQVLAMAGRSGGGTYEVPLHVNRLALTVDDKGSLESWPLAPATLQRGSFPTGASSAIIGISASGGELGLASADQVRLLSLGPEIKELGAGIKQAGVISLAAAPAGRVLVATSDSLILFRFTKGQQTTQEAITFSGGRAVTASATGETGFVLFGCDSNTSCLTQVTLATAFAEVPNSKVQLDCGPSASILSTTRDGKGVVVTDGTGIFGIYYSAAPPATPHKSKVAWTYESTSFTGQPVGVDRAPAVVSGQAVDLFAVAEQSKKLIYLLAFNAGQNFDLQVIGSIPVAEPPTRIAFGRRTQLFIAAGKSVFTLDAGQASPVAAPVAEVVPANPIQYLLVQP